MKLLASAAVAALILVATVTAQNGQRQTAGDWSSYSLNPAGTRYSPLTDITPANVGTLTQAWSLRLTEPAGRRGGGPAPTGDDEAQPARGRGAGAPAQGRGGAAAAVDPSGVAQ